MRMSQFLEGVECSQSFEDNTNFPAFWKAPIDESRQIQLYLVSLGTVPVCSYVQRFIFCISLLLQNVDDGYTEFFCLFRHFHWPVW